MAADRPHAALRAAAARTQGAAHMPHAPHESLTPPCARRAGASPGFTLVEVLVALSVMAVMAVMTWRGIDGMLRASHASHARADESLTLQAALVQWKADLDAMMVWPVAVADAATAATASTSAASGAPPAAAPQSLHWDGRLLRITRQTAGDAGAGLRVVAWLLHTPSGQWLRWQSAPFVSVQGWRNAWAQAQHWANSANPAGEGQSTGQGNHPNGGQAVAAAAAQDWQLHYFRQGAWSHALSSAAQGSATQGQTAATGAAQAAAQAADARSASLPDGIRLTLTLSPGQHFGGALVIDWVRPSFGVSQ